MKFRVFADIRKSTQALPREAYPAAGNQPLGLTPTNLWIEVGEEFYRAFSDPPLARQPLGRAVVGIPLPIL